MEKIPFFKPDITESEISAVTDVLRSGWITSGPKLIEFERAIKEYTRTDGGVVCLSSATAALELTLRMLGIGEGDEVITTAYTYTATASVILHMGAKAVLVDTRPNSYEIDAELVGKAINGRTKAIIAVDIGGVICDYARLLSTAEEKRGIFRANSALQSAFGRIVVIADAAHSFGSVKDGAFSGTHADFTCFSFHAVKNLTTSEGGCVTWKKHGGIDDDELTRRFKLNSLHGQNKSAFARKDDYNVEYDISEIGYKCNMTDIQAAIGISQLARYERTIAYRHEIISVYESVTDSARVSLLPHSGADFRSNAHLCMARIAGIDSERRNMIISEMARKYGVMCNIHFRPLPMMTAYKALGYDISDYPNAFSQYENEITLPVYSEILPETAEYIADSLNNCI